VNTSTEDAEYDREMILVQTKKGSVLVKIVVEVVGPSRPREAVR
jgi:hypothetical protein